MPRPDPPGEPGPASQRRTATATKFDGTITVSRRNGSPVLAWRTTPERAAIAGGP